MSDCNINEGQENTKEVSCISKWSYGRFMGCLSVSQRHEVPDLHLDGIQWDFVCIGVPVHAYASFMCACWRCVSVCQGTLAPADEEIKSESAPASTSCPPTPGASLTSLSYWLLVTTQCPQSD